VNYLLDSVQEELLDGLGRLLANESGTARAMTLGLDTYDTALHGLLVDTGFLHLGRGPETGSLEAALVVEAVAASGGGVAAASAALVAPALLDDDPPGPIALADRAGSSLVRFASVASTVLALDGDRALVVEVEPAEIEAVRSTFGVPVGRVPTQLWDRGRDLGPGSGDVLRRWWRTAIAVEQVGLLSEALRITVEHVNTREQFGHPIAAFQAVRHRLAECAVLIEGARWLARETAALGAPAEAAATACTHATVAAKQVAAETHQLSGAIGFTKEYPLHVFTTRAQGLTLELGGLEAHARAVTDLRWRSPAP
jgi:alkylation response protein AidB-like acyl-CoA dehydrogenase